MIYFVEGVGSGLVKIGYVKGSVSERMKTIRTHSPFDIRLLASCAGDRQGERRLHERYSSLRVRGEWFRHEGRLADLIRRIGIADKSVEEEVTNITVTAVNVSIWRRAKADQLRCGVPMHEWIEDAILRKLDGASEEGDGHALSIDPSLSPASE